jgi:hypothetical protein
MEVHTYNVHTLHSTQLHTHYTHCKIYVYRYISCNLLYMYVYGRANRAEDK